MRFNKEQNTIHQVFLSGLEGLLPRLAEDFLKGTPEVPVEDGVNGWVEGAVAVTDPEEELEKREGDLTRVSTNPVQAVAEEKGEPAHHKHPHDHSQDECKPLLSRLGDLFPGERAPATLPPGDEEVHGFVANPGDANWERAFLLATHRGSLGVPLLRFVTFALRGGALLHVGLLSLQTHGDCALARCGRALAVTVLPLPVERRRRLAQSILSLYDTIRSGILPGHTPGSGFGHLVYSDVHQDHYQAGRKEGGSAGGEDVPSVIIQLTLRLRADLLVAVDRHERRG